MIKKFILTVLIFISLLFLVIFIIQNKKTILYFTPQIEYNTIKISIPKEWLLHTYLEKNKKPYYFGFLQIHPILLYPFAIINKKVTFEDISYEISSYKEYYKKTLYEKIYMFYQNDNEISIFFDSKIENIKSSKILYENLKNENNKSIILNNYFISHLVNYNKEVLVSIKTDKESHETILYQFIFDNFIMNININKKIHQPVKGLESILKEINSK